MLHNLEPRAENLRQGQELQITPKSVWGGRARRVPSLKVVTIGSEEFLGEGASEVEQGRQDPRQVKEDLNRSVTTPVWQSRSDSLAGSHTTLLSIETYIKFPRLFPGNF